MGSNGIAWVARDGGGSDRYSRRNFGSRCLSARSTKGQIPVASYASSRCLHPKREWSSPCPKTGSPNSSWTGSSTVGFIGVEAVPNSSPILCRRVGSVIDRTRRYIHEESESAVALDELAIAIHQSSPLQIDPKLGWHLWATDLCLQVTANRLRTGLPIINVPLYHNTIGRIKHRKPMSIPDVICSTSIRNYATFQPSSATWDMLRMAINDSIHHCGPFNRTTSCYCDGSGECKSKTQRRGRV